MRLLLTILLVVVGGCTHPFDERFFTEADELARSAIAAISEDKMGTVSELLAPATRADPRADEQLQIMRTTIPMTPDSVRLLNAEMTHDGSTRKMMLQYDVFGPNYRARVEAWVENRAPNMTVIETLRVTPGSR